MLLLARMPNILLNLITDQGVPPLSYVVANANVTQLVLHLLVNVRGADVNHRNLNGDTPLSYAIMRGSVSTVRFLLDADAYTHFRSKRGETMLHHAVRRAKNVSAVVALLLERGENVHAKAFNGRSAWDEAALVPGLQPEIQRLLDNKFERENAPQRGEPNADGEKGEAAALAEDGEHAPLGDVSVSVPSPETGTGDDSSSACATGERLSVTDAAPAGDLSLKAAFLHSVGARRLLLRPSTLALMLTMFGVITIIMLLWCTRLLTADWLRRQPLDGGLLCMRSVLVDLIWSAAMVAGGRWLVESPGVCLLMSANRLILFTSWFSWLLHGGGVLIRWEVDTMWAVAEVLVGPWHAATSLLFMECALNAHLRRPDNSDTASSSPTSSSSSPTSSSSSPSASSSTTAGVPKESKVKSE
jgi:Ankyrin repeats (3 copies)